MITIVSYVLFVFFWKSETEPVHLERWTDFLPAIINIDADM